MIRLYSAETRTFSGNGDYVLNPLSLKETKKKSLNGWFIEVELPIKYKDLIIQDNLCVIQTKSKINPQAFRINSPKFTTTKVKFTAHHVMFDAERYFLLDVRPTNMSAIGSLNYTNERTDTITPFSYISNVNATSTAYFIRKSLLEAWSVIEERWGGVFDADNFHITFKVDTPVDKGECVTYGVDMQGFEIIEDWSSVVTKLYPTGNDGLMLPEKFLLALTQYDEPYPRTIQFTSDLDTEEAPESELIVELRNKAQTYLNINQYPKVSYTVKSDIKNDLEINDLIVVKHPQLTLNTSVQEYVYNPITKRVISLTFGNYNRDIKKRFDKIVNEITENKNKLGTLEQLTTDQTNMINSMFKNGHVVITDNEILILDKLPKSAAKDVWRWNMGGLGFSSNGYEGPFEYAFTQDGKFNASFIGAGSITTNMLSSDVGSTLDISSNTSINMLVSILSDTNYLYNNVGLEEMKGWTFDTNPLIFSNENPFQFTKGYPFINLNGPIMYPIKTNTNAGMGFKIWKNGKIKSLKNIAPQGEKICLRTKLLGKGKLVIKLTQYNSTTTLSTSTLITKTVNDEGLFEGETVQHPNTTHIELIIESDIDAYGSSQESVVFTDTMLTRNYYQDFDFSSTEIFSYVNMQIVLINGKIELMASVDDLNKVRQTLDATNATIELEAQRIDSINGDIHNASIDINALEGITALGKKFAIKNEDGSKTIFEVRTINGKEEIYMYGTIQSEGGDIVFDSAGKRIKIGTTEIRNWGTTRDVLAFYGNQFTYVMDKNGGVSINNELGSTQNTWVIFKNFDTDDVTMYADRIKPRLSGNNDVDYGRGSFTSIDTGTLSAGTFNAISVFPKASSDPQTNLLGHSGNRWRSIFLQNQPNVSSDNRLKYNIANIDPILLDCFENLERKSFLTKHDDMFSFGFVAQDVERCLFKYVVKVWGYEDAKEWMKRFKLLSKDESYLSLLYAEVEIIIGAVEKRKINQLETRIQQLENKLDLLLKKEGIGNE